jgi:L-seryl-tRNA(Ser) seleniumtransferase
MTENNTHIYDELGVPRAINAAGTKTRIGGTRIRPEAAEAMHRAATSFARISDLQARASQTIREVTGAEAGYVASGASACLTLAAAAAIAGDELDVMSRLPDTDGVADEILVPKVHRNSYDHALRAAGATLVDVGNNDQTLGPVANDLERWEVESAITDETAAVAYVARNDLPIEPLVDVAHDHGLPVIVDAAGRLPPKENLTRFVDAGADLVVFSGGKGIRGPQSTGIVAGRRDLVSSIALQHLDMDAVVETWDPPDDLVDVDSLPGVPRHGIGRGFKVGKEELVGLVRALELYDETDEREDFAEWDRRARYVGRALSSVSILDVTYLNGDDPTAVTTVEVTVDESQLECTTVELVRKLRTDRPRIFVGDRRVTDGVFTVHPFSLTDEEAQTLVDRIIESLSVTG